MNKELCQISGKLLSKHQLLPALAVSDSLVSFIKSLGYEWNREGYISVSELNHFVKQKLEQMVEESKGKLDAEEKDVLASFTDYDIMAEDVDTDYDKKLTAADRLSDMIADFGGSWAFILIFFSVIACWIGLNVFLPQRVDPYPFILLNLILSCLAAVQAPIIMMSQKRQEARDRLRSKNDYKVNLKAELEIRQLHEKIDHLARMYMKK
ncbi:MAG: DUF1003 domain-containing protein [Bacteroidota bacterium]|jgi:uncharacterized membrane protein|nr:DUF1003 domain-containing protein [Sphingobacteriales bacterium]